MHRVFVGTDSENEKALVSRWLGDGFDIAPLHDRDQILSEQFDICILDVQTFEHCRDWVVKRRKSGRISPPRFLVMIQREQIEKFAPHIGDAIDDLLYLPLNKTEFELRISTQLRLNCSPRNKTEMENPVRPAPEKKASDISGLSILAVDDYILNHKIIEFQLAGLDVTIVDSGPKALEMLSEKHFDIVLMDIQMPGMDGYQATRNMRNPASGILDPNIPVIALSAHEMDTQKDKAAEAGIDGFVTKPLQRKILLAEIARVLADRSRSGGAGRASETIKTENRPDRKIATQKPTPNKPDTGHKIMDMEAAIQMMGGKKSIVEKVCDSLIRELPKKLDTLRSCASAANFRETQRVSHDLKSGARCVCAQKAANLAYDLEMLSQKKNEDKIAEILPQVESAFEELLRKLRDYRKA